MEEEETEAAPVRVRLVFADRHLLTKAQRSEGLRRSWAVLRPDLDSVAEFSRDITSRFGLRCNSRHGLILSMDGFIVPPSESVSIFSDNDKIRVSKKKKKKKKKKTVAAPASVPQIEGNVLINKGTIASSNNKILLIDNGDNITQKKKKKKKRSLKRKQKEAETPTDSKKKKLRLVANERPIIINENKNNATPSQFHTVNRHPNAPIVASERKKKLRLVANEKPVIINENKINATPSQFHTVNRQPNAPIVASERNNEQIASIRKNASTGFHGGRNDKNAHGACAGNGTHQFMPTHLIPGQTRFMSPGAGPSNWQENGPRRRSFQGNGTMTKRSRGKPRNGSNGPNAHNRNRQPWRESNGPDATYSQLRMDNNIFSDGEEINENKIYFESLDPLPRLPMEGDIIAYRLDIIDSLGCPGLSSFRVGEVIVFDPVLMVIFLRPVPEYSTPERELSEYEKSMYQEDGSLEIDFEYLLDLRVVKESLEIDFEYLLDLRVVKESSVKAAPKLHGKGKNKSKGSRWMDDAENAPSPLGGNNNNVNSAWEVGEASNAKEATQSNWDTWQPSTSRAGTSRPSTVPCGTVFGSHGGFSRGRNGSGGNSNTNFAWEAAIAVDTNANANGNALTQQNGWDPWVPSNSRAGASRPSMGQHGSGPGFRGGVSRRGRSGSRRGNYLNRRFNK